MPHQSEQKKSTHIFFDGEKMIISPDIVPIFNFLIEIEKEVESILKFDRKLEGIKDGYMEMLDLVQFLGGKLKENKINFQYTFKKNPKEAAKEFSFYFPIRSQMIVIFASLEVLYFLHIAYEKEVGGEDKMREIAMRDKKFLKKFLNSFLLTEENSYYASEKDRLSRIDSTKLRGLRNALTHFFSISGGGLSVVNDILSQKARRLERVLKESKKGNIVFISPEDMYELVRSAHILRIKKWSDDFQNDKKLFQQKMQSVISLVKKYGAIVVPDKDIKV